MSCVYLTVCYSYNQLIKEEQPQPQQIEIKETSNKENACYIIVSFDGYRRYWPGFLHFFNKFNPNPKWPIYFISESIPPPTNNNMNITHFKTGPGNFGTRIKKALEQIEEDYVFYLEEDIWLTDTLDVRMLENTLKEMIENDLTHYKLHKPCEHNYPMMYEPNNPKWYVLSHQPSWWFKDFLYGTLTDNMTVFTHEIYANKFIQTHPELCSKVKCGTSIPFIDASRQGVLRDVAKQMLEKEKLTFTIGENEVLTRPNK